MCGIVGYLNLNDSPLDPSEELIGSMCHTIAHRGPDEEGQKIIGPVALGMTRLSIIDLTTGQQPITNEDGSTWIVFNGEIYNYQDLQKLVVAKGHQLKTTSDTEVIVHLYEEYGVDCLQHLEGMFAFAIWDSKLQRLFIARDRMGEKPLHFCVFDGQFIFGSELKGILCHPKARSRMGLDPVALQKYLALEYVPAPQTIFQGIEKLMPGHFLLVQGGQVKVQQYWEPKPGEPVGSEDEAVERLLNLLRKSIRGRLIADVPLGVFLSGGIDSSAIAALAGQERSERLKTFSIGFSDASFDESEYAKKVADHLGTDHQMAVFSPDLARQTLEELWEFLDEPLADGSIVPTYFLSKMTKQHVKVALAGEGGDELFGGYPTYQAHKWADIWTSVPKPLRKGVLEPAIRSLPVSHNNLSFDYKAKRFIKSVDEAPVTRHLRWMGAIPLAEHQQLLRPELVSLSTEDELYPRRIISNGQNGHNDVVSTIMKLDLNTYLPDDLLVKSDRASMAASLEVRLPFLAWPLIEFALALPPDLKVRGRTTKYLLKKAVTPYLPPEIMKRPKKGFGIPVAKWLRSDFKSMVDELLAPDFVKQQGIFNVDYLLKLRLEHENGQVDRRKELWTLFMFQWWWRKFFGAHGG